MNSLKGKFLVASPHLPDDNFTQTVVLLLEHAAAGALGLILNRPMEVSVQQFWKQLGEETDVDERSVRHGGPVEGPVMSLHHEEKLSDFCVLPRVFATSSGDKLRQLAHQDSPSRLFFTGYAGWSAKQLESELKAGGWLLVDGTFVDVFSEDQDLLWKKMANRAGQSVLQRVIRPDQFLGDASQN